MTGRDLVLAALKRQPTPRVPWVPFTGVHIGSLKGVTAEALLKSADLLVACGEEASERYQPDGQPVVFDLQVEAEILGCELQWADDAPPAVKSHPLAVGYEVLEDLEMPQPRSGRLPVILEAMRVLKQRIGQDTALYGLVVGPFTLALHLRGTNLFLDMFDQPEAVGELMHFCRQVTEVVAAYYIDAGMDVIAVVDPMISQISAEHFQQFVSKDATHIFDFIRQKGAYSSFFVCGNATPVLEVMAQCKPDGLSVDENVDMVFAKQVADRYAISYGGNIPLTTVMLHGDQADNMQAALELIDSCNGPGFILSPGCDMPFDVKPENVSAITLTVFDPDKARVFVQTHHKQADLAQVELELPDYAHLSRPLIEVITLDSATCPPCKYMVDATREVAKLFEGKIDWVEYKITEKANIVRMQRLGVTNIPTIVINGQPTFASYIPDIATYKREIEKVLQP
ncbi:MAG: uroporphyrinogen decarboxylase [Firmicutes bacterium]|nr:uroporphyrinogen decarboxylase [Bacillota bacterium]